MPVPDRNASPLPFMSMSLGERVKPLSSGAGVVEPLTTSSSPLGLDIPSYPPTEVQRWLTCPVFRAYSKTWEPRVSSWTPHRLVGTAIHAGITAFLKPLVKTISLRDSGASSSPEAPALSPLSIALQTLTDGYEAQETWAIESLQAHVTKGVKLAISGIERDILRPGTTIIAVEMADPHNILPPGVKVPRIIDCIMEYQERLQVWDWKSHIKLDPQYLGERQRSIIHSWQLLDYGWHAQEWFKLPVALVGTGEIILTPKAQFLPVPVVVTPARLAQWREDAKIIWTEMRWTDDSGYPPWHNWMACTDRHLFYGKECEFMSACHDLSGDESLFSGVYKVREPNGS